MKSLICWTHAHVLAHLMLPMVLDEVNAVILVSFLWMKKLKPREVRAPAQGYTVELRLAPVFG